jgi:WD40 repeat protein/uncharacterized caspase-like protein
VTTGVRIGCLWVMSLIVGAPASLGQTAPKPADPARPSLYGLVIGIDEYEDRAIPACPGAPGDARAVRRWLVEQGGWNPSDLLLMDRASQRSHGGPRDRLANLYPSRDNLRWAVQEWLKARAQPNDLIVIYFAGQAVGLPPREQAPPGSPGRNYLLPIDARQNNIDGTGWAIEDSLDALAATGTNPVIVLLDTSLEGRGQSVVPPSKDVSSALWLATIARWPTVSAWLAADGKPAPDGDHDRSPFSKSLLLALGNPETPRNLVATLGLMGRDPALASQGFRTAGGVPADLTLWAKELAPVGQAPPALLLQHGHANRVLDLVISRDGSTAYSASADSTVKAWRLDDRTLLRTLSSHTINVTKLALSPDGRHLATGDGAGRLWVWSLPDFRPLQTRTLRPHEGEVVAIAFLDDGRHFASLDAAGRVLLWEISGKDAAATLMAENASALACGADRIAVAALNDQNISNISLYDANGKPAGTVPGPGGPVTYRGLAMDGSRLAIGDREGHVLVWDTARNAEIRRFDQGGPITALRLGPAFLAAGCGADVRILPLTGDAGVITVSLEGDVERITLSEDGKALAAATESGDVVAWDVADPRHPGPLCLESAGTARVVALAFGPGGRTLVAGCQDGSLASWDLPQGTRRPAIKARRAQLAGLAASPDGRYLVQITLDRRAALWDLALGRNLAPLDGSWTSAAFLPDGQRLAMTDEAGDVVLVDRESRARLAEPAYERPPAEDGDGPSRAAFRIVTVSPDGTWIAAGSAEAGVACVWEAATGRLRRTIRAHPDGVASLAFSADSKALLSAGPDGSAKLWRLAAGEQPDWSVETPDNPITAAVLEPGEPARIVTGHQDGTILRWTRGQKQPLALGRLEGAVQALMISADGAWLAAGGDDKAVRTIALNTPRSRLEPLEPRHDERVRALAAWPGSPVVASASEDSTIRFWRIADRAPLGTLSADPVSGEWVAFTPEGRFDSSPGAERQVSWLREGRVMPLDQFYDRYREFRLTNRLRGGTDPAVRIAYRTEVPPAIALDRPPARSARRELPLSLTLGEENLSNLRLYLNGVPVREGEDFVRRDPDDPRRLIVEVALRRGTNTLYAMAGRGVAGEVEGRSNVVEIVSDAPDQPGRLHVLALGVDDYPNRPLKFSAKDARAIADFLHRHAAEPELVQQGLVKVLRNREIDPDAIRLALAEIRARSRPEDTVVVFLAGHTDVQRDHAGRERFCLLLPDFPFPPIETGAALAARGSPRSQPAQIGAEVVPYYAIYQYLVRMNALQRLVIIDACQAAAAVDDPRVRQIQENVAAKVDDEAHRARTTYLLASRKNEPAFEVEELGHGLLTHVLLRGMGAPGLKDDPAGPLPPADRDSDGLVTTTELSVYVDQHLPVLAARLAPVAMRSGLARQEERGTAQPRPLQVQTAPEATFPLVRLPAGVTTGR